ncbi:hypothetical protein P245_21015 [Comamonas thiooxydans]|uniref:Uncharacterized protein n=1 Tax=Comamonas thiooxydans TaxID=363952 RepID=A0A0E3B9Y0_9BURK|nr:hypothetical protein [Comamonas thiooxydans]KGG86202.1 hypothetical protein P245_21015 [Comamonas thiooxydans]
MEYRKEREAAATAAIQEYDFAEVSEHITVAHWGAWECTNVDDELTCEVQMLLGSNTRDERVQFKVRFDPYSEKVIAAFAWDKDGNIWPPQTKIVFPKYGSDGPGYCGTLEYHIIGDQLLITEEVYEPPRRVWDKPLPQTTRSLTLPTSLPRLVGVSDYCKSKHEQLLLDNFSEMDVLEYVLDGQLCIQEDRIKILMFDDETVGYLMIHGECCYLSLVVPGHMRASIEAYDSETDVTLF